MTSGRVVLDLKGMKFGKLEVIELYRVHPSAGGIWLCRCSCGRSPDFPVRAANLKSGGSTRCQICKNERQSSNRMEDLTGMIFGNLTVIKLAPRNAPSKKGYTPVRWMCRCSCGRSEDFSVLANTLKVGKSRYCKICQNEQKSKSRIQDLKGIIYGWLRVTEFVKINDFGTYWKCYCDPELGGCGGEIICKSQELKKGDTKSCGCLTESKIAADLKKYFVNNYKAEKEYKMIKNPMTNRWLKCDIYIPENNIYIEVNGDQHYGKSRFHLLMARRNGTTEEEEFEYQKYRDDIKRKYAQKNGNYIEVDIRKMNTTDLAIKYIENRIWSI
jgi:hypothetical protein